MQRDRRGIGDIEARKRAFRRDAAQSVAMLLAQLTQTYALGAEHECERPCQRSRLQRHITFLGESDARIAKLAEFGESLGKILDEHDGHDVERAARDLGERAGEWRAVPLGQNETRCAEGGGRAEHGADIMRIGDLIQHDEDAIGIGLVEPDGRQLLDLERDSLMHLVGAEQSVEIARRGVLDAHVALCGEGSKPLRGVFGGDQPDERPFGIGERGFDGVQPEQNY